MPLLCPTTVILQPSDQPGEPTLLHLKDIRLAANLEKSTRLSARNRTSQSSRPFRVVCIFSSFTLHLVTISIPFRIIVFPISLSLPLRKVTLKPRHRAGCSCKGQVLVDPTTGHLTDQSGSLFCHPTSRPSLRSSSFYRAKLL